VTIFWNFIGVLAPGDRLALGNVYPQTLLPLFPCPLTVFAIALVAAAAPNVDREVFVLLLPWAVMAPPKCFGALIEFHIDGERAVIAIRINVLACLPATR
jgi:hypothetical protein